jgi:hypothetical protein
LVLATAVPFHVPLVTVPKNELPETERAVEDAYGNCEEAVVDVEKKTPIVHIEELVADVVVLNVLMCAKGS